MSNPNDRPAAPAAANPNRVEIQLDERTAQGEYANLAIINHTETEFVLDFIFVQPQQPGQPVRGKTFSRIISSPAHTKRLMLALQQNVLRYERRFGEIRTQAPEPSSNGGESTGGELLN
jgi:hypothetical protein